MSGETSSFNRRQDRVEEPWRRRFVPGFLRREKTAGQVVRFGMVGVSNTVVDFALYNLLYPRLLNLLYPMFSFSLVLGAAGALSASGGIVNSFIWNKHWTFSARESGHWGREMITFGAISVSALLVNIAGIYGLHEVLGGTSILAINLQKLGASIASMTWNFLGYRYIAFRPRSTHIRDTHNEQGRR